MRQRWVILIVLCSLFAFCTTPARAADLRAGCYAAASVLGQFCDLLAAGTHAVLEPLCIAIAAMGIAGVSLALLRRRRCVWLTVLAAACMGAVAAGSASAGLVPGDVAVIVNSNAKLQGQSEAVGRYYCYKRGIPLNHLIEVDTDSSEVIPPNEYPPLAQQIRDKLVSQIGVDPSDFANDPIQVLVLCTGIPTRVQFPDGAPSLAVDGALTMLFNTSPDIAPAEYTHPFNPYYAQNQDFASFRASDANTTTDGDVECKLRYLVCRLDGYESPTVDVPGFETMSRDVRDLIDRGAASAGQTGRFVLDEPWDSSYVPPRYIQAAQLLPGILDPALVIHDATWETRQCYVGTWFQDDLGVMGYASYGMHDKDISLQTQWGRPKFHWKPGAIAIIDESYSGQSVRPSQWVAWCHDNQAQVLQTPELKVTANRVEFPDIPTLPGYTLVLKDATPSQNVLATAVFDAQGVATIDLTQVNIPATPDTQIVEVHYPANDDGYHDGELLQQSTIQISSSNGHGLYGLRAKGQGLALIMNLEREKVSEYIRDGCSGINAGVSETGDNFVDDGITLPRYAQGYTWAEAAALGTYDPAVTLLIGDPLMAPYATPPAVSITAPAQTIVRGTVSIAASAQSQPDPATGIASVSFWLIPASSPPQFLGSVAQSPYSCSLDTTTEADGQYTIRAVAYENNSQREAAEVTKDILIANAHPEAASFSSARGQTNGTAVALSSRVVSAGTGSSMDGAFYISDAGGAAGLRIAWAGDAAAGQLVSVMGTMGNNAATGERELVAQSVVFEGSAPAPSPKATTNQTLGGTPNPQIEPYTVAPAGSAGLYNVGVLMRTWGVVTAVTGQTAYIDDGSGVSDADGAGLRVDLGDLPAPAIGGYVAITGISSVDNVGSAPVRLLRATSIDLLAP